MLGALIGVLAFMALIIGGALFLVKKLAKAPEAGEDGKPAAPKNQDKTAQDFVKDLFKTTDSSMINLGNGDFRMVVEVSSINYRLMTSDEIYRIEQLFKNAVSSWTFPFAFYVQSREMDKREILSNTYNDIQAAVSKFPGLADYGKAYYSYLGDENGMLQGGMGNPLTKKKYVIVGNKTNANTLENSNEEEKKKFVMSELYNEASTVVGSLQSIGLSGEILKSYELNDLLFQAINKSNGEVVDGISEGDYTSGFVSESEAFRMLHKDDSDVDAAVTGFINSLYVKVLNNRNATKAEQSKATQVIAKLRGDTVAAPEYSKPAPQPTVKQAYAAPAPSYSAPAEQPDIEDDDDMIISL